MKTMLAGIALVCATIASAQEPPSFTVPAAPVSALASTVVAASTPVPSTTTPSAPAVAEPTPVQYQDVVPVEGASADQLYNAALLWFPQAFKSGKDVLQVQNKEAGVLVSTGIEPYEPVVLMGSACTRGLLRYRLTVEVKEGRYRYTFDGFVHEATGAQCKGSPISFGVLTTAPAPPPNIGKMSFFGGLPENDRLKLWRDLKKKAGAIADLLSSSLREKIGKADSEKPW